MVENSQEQRGFIPNNILENINNNQVSEFINKSIQMERVMIAEVIRQSCNKEFLLLQQQVRIREATLNPSSTPEEVTAWLQDKGFSRM